MPDVVSGARVTLFVDGRPIGSMRGFGLETIANNTAIHETGNPDVPLAWTGTMTCSVCWIATSARRRQAARLWPKRRRRRAGERTARALWLARKGREGGPDAQ